MRNTLHISKPLKHPWCWFLLCLFSIALPSLVFSQPPVLTNDALPAGPLYELQLTQKPTHYYQLYRHAAPGTPGRLVSMVSGADPRALRDVMGPTSMAMYHVEEVPLGANIDSDNDGLTDTQELASPLLMNPLNPAPSLPLVSGTVRMPTRLAFEGMALRDDVPGALGLREVKFLIEGADTANPKLYFINTQNQSLHYYFYRDELGGQLGIVPWNSVTYFTQNRQFIAGTLAAHDHVVRPDGGTGVYTMEFWPTDPVEFNHVEMAYELIRRSMPFAEGQFVYHPAGETQRDLLELQSDDFASAHIQTITSEELYGDTDYTALNLGEAYGRLRVIGPGDTESIRDIVIFTTIPNDLSHVAGVITAAPQTPLSHINLKAKQNNTPNAYIRDAHTRPDIAPLLGQYVHYQVTPDGYILEPATQQEVDDWLEQVRPAVGVNPLANLTVTDIAPLTAIGHADADAFGSKAANLAELRSILPGVAPDGVAVPFYLYDQYMRANGFYAQAATLMAQPTFQNGHVRLVPGQHHPALPQQHQQRGPARLQWRRPVRILHAPPRRGSHHEIGETGLGRPVDLPRLGGTRVLPHRPSRGVYGRLDPSQLRRRAGQRRRRHTQHLRPELDRLLHQRAARRGLGHQPRGRLSARRTAGLADRSAVPVRDPIRAFLQPGAGGNPRSFQRPDLPAGQHDADHPEPFHRRLQPADSGPVRDGDRVQGNRRRQHRDQASASVGGLSATIRRRM